MAHIFILFCKHFHLFCPISFVPFISFIYGLPVKQFLEAQRKTNLTENGCGTGKKKKVFTPCVITAPLWHIQLSGVGGKQISSNRGGGTFHCTPIHAWSKSHWNMWNLWYFWVDALGCTACVAILSWQKKGGAALSDSQNTQHVYDGFVNLPLLLTSQISDSGVPPLICCHEALLQRQNESGYKLLIYKQRKWSLSNSMSTKFTLNIKYYIFSMLGIATGNRSETAQFHVFLLPSWHLFNAAKSRRGCKPDAS